MAVKVSYLVIYFTQSIKKVRLIRYIEQNFVKIIHDVALAIKRHNAMPMPILAVLL